MIRRAAGLGIAAAAAAFALDRWLAARRGTAPPTPLRMLAVVDARIAATWSVLADIPLQVEWMREMKQVTVITPGPVGIGTRGTAIVRVFGIPVPDPVEVVEFEPPTRYAIRHHGVFAGSGTITLEAGADGTTTIVRWEEALRPVVLPELGSRIAGLVLQPIFQADLLRFGRLVETGSADG
jgi:Polyketide cyclase / dehydrase and lipid transport